MTLPQKTSPQPSPPARCQCRGRSIPGVIHSHVRVPMRGISVHPTAGEPPFVVYDYSHPDTARSYRDETLPKEAHKVAHFCSMRISHNIRAEAQKEGLDAMAAKYRQGGDLYMSVVEAAKIPIGG